MTSLLATNGGKGIRIGVVDSGYSRSWPDTRVVPGYSLVPRDDGDACVTDVDDELGHGTACADLILRVAPCAEIVPIRIFGKRLSASPRTLASAIRTAAELRLDVVNVSLGTLRMDSMRSLYAACESAYRGGVIVVAAVNSRTGWSAPAIFENCIGVGLKDARDDYSIDYRCSEAIEFIACGEHSNVAWAHGRRERVCGTSYAAPIVSGWIARMLSVFPGTNLDEARLLWRS